MSRPTENNEGMSIPRFGGWDEKGATSYSVVFSRARDKRKQCKSDVMCSLANDQTSSRLPRLKNTNPTLSETPKFLLSNKSNESGTGHGRRSMEAMVVKRVHQCEIRGKTFATGQALGGHKTHHWVKP
ncbi:dihydropyrimidinase-like [Hibiscus syriacus]|uniref:Dihydropyrimidinase-like n=1 Tax=Hibiscus syriacus TaxID=106335 RepID=A0A6A2WGE5_HIBSY|nr:dihydropyrimidinase-like [Hibiscus syriacus]